MKKLISILLLTIYASIAFGMTINFHSCGSHLAKVSLLNIEGQKRCLCDTGSMPKDCCKDNLVVQRTGNHRAVQNVSTVDFMSFSVAPTLSYKNYDSSTGDRYEYDFINNWSRGSCSNPIYLLNRIFRI